MRIRAVAVPFSYVMLHGISVRHDFLLLVSFVRQGLCHSVFLFDRGSTCFGVEIVLPPKYRAFVVPSKSLRRLNLSVFSAWFQTARRCVERASKPLEVSNV